MSQPFHRVMGDQEGAAQACIWQAHALEVKKWVLFLFYFSRLAGTDLSESLAPRVLDLYSINKK